MFFFFQGIAFQPEKKLNLKQNGEYFYTCCKNLRTFE